jgi:ribosomal-protein-alanine N-acetyltransferase
MSHILIAPVRWVDGPELVEANTLNRTYHAPWVEPFTDMEGFESWFGQRVTGPNISLVARDRSSCAVVGVININQIVWAHFAARTLAITECRLSHDAAS